MANAAAMVADITAQALGNEYDTLPPIADAASHNTTDAGVPPKLDLFKVKRW
jgi:hypothetical protein